MSAISTGSSERSIAVCIASANGSPSYLSAWARPISCQMALWTGLARRRARARRRGGPVPRRSRSGRARARRRGAANRSPSPAARAAARPRRPRPDRHPRVARHARSGEQGSVAYSSSLPGDALDPLGECRMEVSTARHGDARVGDLSRHGVLEDVLTLSLHRGAGAQPDEVALLELPEIGGEAEAELVDRPAPERAPDDGRGLERFLLRSVEEVDACGDDGLNRVRKKEASRGARASTRSCLLASAGPRRSARRAPPRGRRDSLRPGRGRATWRRAGSCRAAARRARGWRSGSAGRG